MSETSTPYGEVARARLTRQGQITVPKSIREALGAAPGDELAFEQVEGNVVVRLEPRRSVLAYAGIASDTAPGGGLAGDALTSAVEGAVGASYARKLSRVVDSGASRRRTRD